MLQLSAACKPRASEKRLEGKKALLKGKRPGYRQQVTPGLCLAWVLCPQICCGLEEWGGSKGEGVTLCWDVMWLVIRDASHPCVCIQCCACCALSAQRVMLQLCPLGYCGLVRSWRHARIGDQTSTFPFHHLLEQTCTSVSAAVLVWFGTSCLGLVQAEGSRELCVPSGDSYRRKRGREERRQAAFLTAPGMMWDAELHCYCM